MNDTNDNKTTEPTELTSRPVNAEDAQLSDAELENVSGGFLDAHGDVCIGLGAMATITTGGTKN